MPATGSSRRRHCRHNSAPHSCYTSPDAPPEPLVLFGDSDRVRKACMSACSHRLDRDNSHGGPTHRFADRFRISPIILGGLDIGLDILRAHQLDGIPALFKRPAPVMRTPARLHPDHTWRQTRPRVPHLTSLHARRLSTARPRASAPCNWKTFFAKSMSIKASPFFLTMSVRNSTILPRVRLV